MSKLHRWTHPISLSTVCTSFGKTSTVLLLKRITNNTSLIVVLLGFCHMLKKFAPQMCLKWVSLGVCMPWEGGWVVKPVNRLQLEGSDCGWKGREGTSWEWSDWGNGVGLGCFPSSLSSPLSFLLFLLPAFSLALD